jgi:hypothetical protein
MATDLAVPPMVCCEYLNASIWFCPLTKVTANKNIVKEIIYRFMGFVSMITVILSF